MFDEDHFINALASDVKIIKRLPKEMANASKIIKHFRSWSGMDYYQGEIASMWKTYRVCMLNVAYPFTLWFLGILNAVICH